MTGSADTIESDAWARRLTEETIRVERVGESGSIGLDTLQDYYDLLVVGTGYESRARFVAEKVASLAATRLAFAFDTNHCLAFADNLDSMREREFIVEEVAAEGIYGQLQAVLSILGDQQAGSVVRVAVDTSVFDRTRLAWILLAAYDADIDLSVDFLYAPARESPRPSDAPLRVRGPVVPRFAGWTNHPSLPVALVLGLGYENEQAVGTMELLEPARTWVYLPGSNSSERESVSSANESLWQVRGPDGVIPYDVRDAFGVFESLESLVFGIRRTSRPVIAPFGPQIFAVSSLLVALLHEPYVAVWRVSSGDVLPPTDRTSDGTLTGLRVQFGRR